jgi:adenosylhomocysteinase
VVKPYEVKDIGLADKGRLLVEWAETRMPVLMRIRGRFGKEEPLRGVRVGGCLHVTKETAVLAETLQAGGASLALCGSNPLSTQDEVAAVLAEKGVNVYAWRGESNEEYYRCIRNVLAHNPVVTMDDGADLVTTLHTGGGQALKSLIGGTEETTTGIKRLETMAKSGDLKRPVIAVNDAYTKYLFDNRYGTGQSTVDAIMRATSSLLAGRVFVVVGYGWCGRGIAMRARGLGARVVVTEVDPLRALEAVMDGFEVTSLDEVVERGEIFVTATGNTSVVRKRHMLRMRDGAILANSGHFNVEISIPDLEAISTGKRVVRPNVEEYRLRDGRRLYLLAEGRLVNLVAAEGHPPEVMDMSFANQALCVEYLARKGKNLEPRVHKVPEDIDRSIARLKLETMGIRIDTLTAEQKRYLFSWKLGT